MPFLVGPTGGIGGDNDVQSFPPAGAAATMLDMGVRSGDVIDSIWMQYQVGPGNGTVQISGSIVGPQHVSYDLTYQYITKIRGTYGAYVFWGNAVVITQIQFTFNAGNTSDMFGSYVGARSFEYDIPTGFRLTGFWGRVGAGIDSLGFQLSPA
jgi:hypothetical protein